MTFKRAGGTCCLVGVVAALALLLSAFLPIGAVADEPAPLISRIPGQLKLACRGAENVEACGVAVAGLNAYFKPAFQFGRRLVTGSMTVLDLQGGGPPSEASCEACVEKVRDVQSYLAADVPGPPPKPPSSVELITATLQTACERHFRPQAKVDQCKDELDSFVPLVVNIIPSDYPPLPFCRIKPLAACPSLE
jgi:hypothetical protein